jgi:hypothetical protein
VAHVNWMAEMINDYEVEQSEERIKLLQSRS